MSEVDLHLHSTASDGCFSPEEVVRKAAELGLSVIALADHDTVDGVAPALAAAEAFPGLRVIPAVEISTYAPRGEVHILGYFIDYTSEELNARLKRMRSGRRERAQRMIAKLEDLGLPVSWQRVQEIADTGSIGRPHIAQAMLEKGYIASFGEAFVKYLGRDGLAYVEWQKTAPAGAVELILKADGLPVLAHPLTADNMEALVAELKVAGLAGIEAYYNNYTAGDVAGLIALADKHGLVVTGGSDYHGLPSNTETVIGGADMPSEAAGRLIALAEQRGLGVAGRRLE